MAAKKEIDFLEDYAKLATPPDNALKRIEAGKLKGKSDINPQWRYEALTSVYGPYGYGWKVEIDDTSFKTVTTTDGQILVFVKILLYVKKGEEWSAPAQAYGGDYIVKKDKNGLSPNDEAVKMCVTDAIGKAACMFGVAADVYRQAKVADTKYEKESYENTEMNKKDYLNEILRTIKENNIPKETAIAVIADIGDITTFNDWDKVDIDTARAMAKNFIKYATMRGYEGGL